MSRSGETIAELTRLLRPVRAALEGGGQAPIDGASAFEGAARGLTA